MIVTLNVFFLGDVAHDGDEFALAALCTVVSVGCVVQDICTTTCDIWE